MKKRHPKVPSSDLNHLNFNNMYWNPIQLLFYHVKLFYSLIKKEKHFFGVPITYRKRSHRHLCLISCYIQVLLV
ncbi:hypothetical protein FC690_28305 [Bacillus cereus]|nr:hypothetical protein FC690_28305 [Bacillus cereus]